MKKWIESWLIPFINKYFKTPAQRKTVYLILAALGVGLGWFGIELARVSTGQIVVVGQSSLGEGQLK